MKNLTLWAKNHPRLAIACIVLSGIFQIAFGIRLGRVVLPVVNEHLLDLLVVAIILGVIAIQNNYRQKAPTLSKEREISLRQHTARLLFIGTFVLSLIFGNILQQRLNPTRATSIAYTSEGTHEVSQPVTKKQLRHELKSQLKAYKKQASPQSKPNNTGLIVGGVLLLLAGIFFGSILICAISCGSPALEIVLYALLTVGSFWAGIYFLNKAARLKRAAAK